ncbi:MAG: DUF4252 domain-containing protein [Bacteroidales bacterium]|nr:DUF4252 domain-containing protein [Bacteroidales bacterium]
MKKLLITLLMVLSLGANAWAGGQNAKLRSLVSTYKGTEGFEVVDLGGVGLGLLKAAARSAAESQEDREALKLFSGIKRLTVVDFSDAEPEARDKFLRKANKILKGGEMLMEAKDDGETVRIYGTSSGEGDLLEDIAILAEDALIFVRGTIRMDQVETLMKQAD